MNPYDIAAIRQAILSAWENPRSEEIKNHVLSQHTWEQSARSLADAYQRALARLPDASKP